MTKQEAAQKKFQDARALLDADLKEKSYHGAYLLYGPEGYLIKKYRDQLISALIPAGDTMNLTVYSEKFDENELVDLAKTMPFFADYRVIVLSETGILKSSADRLVKFLKEEKPKETIFIITEIQTAGKDGRMKQVVDKRKGLYKAFAKDAVEIECIRQSAKAIETFVKARIASEHKKLEAKALYLFLSKVGDDLFLIDREIEKLLSYTLMSDTITAADVETVTSGVAQDQIFALVDAIAGKDLKKAVMLYRDLVSLQVAPARISYMITRQYRLLLQTWDLKKRGYPQRELSQAIGVGFVQPYIAQSSRFKRAQLVKSLEMIAKSVSDQRSGLIEERTALEVLITDLCKVSD